MSDVLVAQGGRRLARILRRVTEAIDELGESTVRGLLGGTLTGAQNEGQLATMETVEERTPVVANEVNDSNTCKPCAKIDGKRLGYAPDQLDKIRAKYPGAGFGGYVDCEGRERCRGRAQLKPRARANRKALRRPKRPATPPVPDPD